MVFQCFTLVLVACSLAAQAAYVPQTPPLSTPWTSKVPLDNPLPEYPRPQLVRPDWQSLNGQWQFAGSSQITNPPTGQTLNETILVPFPIESAISGIMRHEPYAFYRRTFTVPKAWSTSRRRVQLNFGAVMYSSTVWVNGKHIGSHEGGYDAFSYDITSALNGGANEIIVGVFNPVDTQTVPIGKQRHNGTGIWYTPATGIWQTVWLEPTQAAHITQLDPIPDVNAGVLNLDVLTSGASGQLVTALVSTGGKPVALASAFVGKTIRLSIPNARLWSPDDPFLYDLRVSLASGDVVTGYFGMRTVGTAVVNGFLRPVLNGRFIFQMGTLDQGFWPDGIYTAPTDAALAFDLEEQKALGFNTVRKHIKVEPARWFYHADKLGLLVFQDMPSLPHVPKTPAEKANFEDQLHRMINQLRGITSIVQWVPFNEGWGEYDEVRITDLTKSFDSTRLINGNSGSSCCGRDPGNGDIIDDHIYVGPGNTNLPTANRVVQLGEFGGIGMSIPGHEWQPGKGASYEMVRDAASYNRRYVEVSATLQGLLWGRGLSGSIYTEPTDVENEVNGYYTYDRQVFKGNFDQFKAVHDAVTGGAAWLRPGESISLGVTTPGATDRFIRGGATSVASDEASRKETTFRVRAGLASSSCFSFEARSAPGRFLRHKNSRVSVDKAETSSSFKRTATWCLRPGRTNSGVSFEALGLVGSFLRQKNGQLYLALQHGWGTGDGGASWAADTTWTVASPNWRSDADITTNARVSLQVTTAGSTDRYLRHQGGVAITSAIGADANATARADATFVARTGFADPGCYSLESANFPGQFLRHSSFRIILSGAENSDIFRRDATFCAQRGVGGEGVTLQSYNIAGHNFRHYNGEVWIAIEGGPKTSDNGASYKADATWRIAAPLT
ncbi:alpha-L-arabinofuranosidase B [Auricularia subglabra TFB-10046 SS5]|nr:alpha-L-arabinofuranosidase B [Auricularia subglabra TFB-10046 SS5]